MIFRNALKERQRTSNDGRTYSYSSSDVSDRLSDKEKNSNYTSPNNVVACQKYDSGHLRYELDDINEIDEIIYSNPNRNKPLPSAIRTNPNFYSSAVTDKQLQPAKVNSDSFDYSTDETLSDSDENDRNCLNYEDDLEEEDDQVPSPNYRRFLIFLLKIFINFYINFYFQDRKVKHMNT